MAQKQKLHPLSKKSQIDALAAPARLEIVDTIEGLGQEATVADIAKQLGKPADSLYYHLRVLVKAGLVQELPDAGNGRRYVSAAGRNARLNLRYEPGKAAHSASVKRVVSGLLRIAGRDFERAIARNDVVVEGDLRELWGSRTKGWVSDKELAEVNRLLTRLGALLHKKRDPRRSRLVSLAWVLAPIDAQPARRGAEE
jgi:DNA-binding transcriptional ArsR family regulator